MTIRAALLAFVVLLVAAPAAVAARPVADFTVSPNPARPGQTVTFDASPSRVDSGHGRLHYWFVDKPIDSHEHAPPSSSPTFQHAFPAGTHTVDLIVEDTTCSANNPGDHCYSSKVRKSFTIAAPDDNPPPNGQVQSGNTGNNVQNGSASANVQIGGGGRDVEKGNGGSDLQFADAKGGVCAVRAAFNAQIDRLKEAVKSALGSAAGPFLRQLESMRDSGNALFARFGCASKRSDFTAASAAAGVDDQLFGGRGNDLQDAGPGNDILIGGPGKDVLIGGRGADDLRSRDRARDIVNCGPGKDEVVADKRDHITEDCELIRRK